MAYYLTDDEVAELWDRYSQGETSNALARRFGKSSASMSLRIQASGGVRPTIPKRAARHLTLEDREEISRGLASGHSYRQIGRLLQRPASTIAREVAANGGRADYRATRAEQAAVKRRKRPKRCKLAASPRLAELVEAKLEQKWSPEQIDGWLKRTYPDDAELQVSHETIYRTLYIQSRGALKRELTGHLRTRRRTRRPGNGNRQRASGSGNLVGMINISERPAEVADRAVPGHWEGDLILGKAMSAIGTLVERTSRFLLLIHLERIKSEHVVAELTRHIQTLPEQLRRSVTWDQGKEMALHATSPSTPASRSTSATPRAPGSAAPTRTPTGCCASTSPNAPTSSPTARPTSTPSPPNSTAEPARPCSS